MEGWQWGTVLVARRDIATTAEWNPATNEVTNDDLRFVYFGKARIVPNKDWRARRHNGENSPMVQQAMRVQLPMRECPPTMVSDIVATYGSPYDNQLPRYVMRVRNPTQSSNAWGRSILVDVDATEDRALWGQLDAMATAHGWNGQFDTFPNIAAGDV
jgi:hypothetical protein